MVHFDPICIQHWRYYDLSVHRYGNLCTDFILLPNAGPFVGVAIYVVGTVDCDWSGLISVSLDGTTAPTFNRRACVGDICEYPWYTKTGLDATTKHALTITLTGPNPATAPSGNIIADLRYLM